MGIVADLLTLLAAQWNTGVIAKPSFIDADTNKVSEAVAHLYVSQPSEGGEIIAGFLTPTAFIKVIPFHIEAFESTEAKLDSTIAEIERIILSATVSGGYYVFTTHNIDRAKTLYHCAYTGIKAIFTTR